MGLVTETYNLATQEAEAGKSQVQDLSVWTIVEFRDSLHARGCVLVMGCLPNVRKALGLKIPRTLQKNERRICEGPEKLCDWVSGEF